MQHRQKEKMSSLKNLSLLSSTLVFTLVQIAPLNSYAQPNGKEEPAEEGIEYAKDASTEINVKNADIAAVVRIFSKKTKRNYILDETVKGKVTIYLPGKVSSEEAIRILDSVLALKGFTSVPIGQNLWKIVQSKDAKTSTIPTRLESISDNPSSAVVTRLLNLKYVNSEDIQQLVSQLVSPEGLINAYTGTNSLIIIDSEDNIERLSEIINSLDVPSSDRDMTIVPVEHADAVELATKLNDILGIASASSASGAGANPGNAMDLLNRTGGANPTGARPGTPGQPATTNIAQVSSSGKTVSARAREPKIIPDERTNAIIIVADEDTTARMKALISQLDSEIDLSGNRFYVYRCQHANAEELAEVLSGLVGGGGAGGTGSTGTTGGSSFNRNSGGDDDGGLFGGSRNSGSRNRGNRFGSTQDRLSGQQRTPGRSRSENGGGTGGPSSFALGENISVTADPATNSLVIVSGKSDYEKILELLKQLDVKRRQVLVEAMLLEVAVDETTSLGTEFLTSTGGSDGGILAKSDFGNLADLFSNPAQLSGFSVAAASSGSLTLPGNITIPTQAILISAARQNANVNVLSSPNLLTTDNEQAEIVVGQNVPFLASQATSDTNLNNTFNQIDRQDVGITLRLTPQISSQDYVTLNIFTEVSNVIESTAGSDLGPTTGVRTSETTVIAKDGQMIVIGGLMANDNVDAMSGVPFLSDIPVLGHLFRVTRERDRRTNLLIFITPRIVKDQFDARDATIIKREHMENVIAEEQTYPTHEELLRSPSIDNTTEAQPDTSAKPGTILAPQKSSSDTASEPETSHSLHADSQGTIELKVAPKLPDQESLEASPQQGNEDFDDALSKQSLSVPSETAPEKVQAALKPSFIQDDGDRILVMNVSPDSEISDKLPFVLTRDQSAFAITIPSGSNAYSRGFFSMGETYAYSADDGKVIFSPSAVFSSPQELASFYPELKGNLYTLSPYEIMNIGVAPWQKSKEK